ncbi:DNA adenine methylase subfamily [Synechococcus sp. PCC 7335]|uniref:DNA adenine methylase n=1 Tax=Synechococcus sp. (strain ATCC 29403 / PCC 7335) TaxID=91464 RepID=UPI00017ECEA9|nr:DNA adenine methylase [Synechococcus sp. PCC 7335]EDX85002.1 DNA adenine methylase subfamily [Synechococcus sp. PCC 7335]
MTPPLAASTINSSAPGSHLVAASRPFLKWAGGKSRLIEQYQPFLPVDFQRYHEPFLGGGALFFHLASELHAKGKRAYLSDLNPELINVYRCVRDQVANLIHQLAIHQQQHSESYYYHVRAAIETEPIARAARFIYLNKTCYNGLYRENSKGKFNVPVGRYKSPKICVPNLLRAASAALQIADISEQSFTHIAEQAQDSQDFVYFDPPYHPLSETSKFTAYSRDRFATEQQIALRDTIGQLATKGVQVLASNSDCPFIRELYTGFKIHTITAARSINSKASKRGKITEVLIAR